MTKGRLLYHLTFLLLILTGCTEHPTPAVWPDERMTAIDSIRQSSGDPQQQRLLLQQLMQKENDSLSYYYAMTRYAFTYLQDAEHADSLFRYLDRARSYFCRFPEDARAAYCLMDLYNHYNVVYSFYAQTDSCIHYAGEAYRLAQQGYAGKKLIKYALNLGDAYNFASQYEKSFFWYHKAMFAADSLQLPEQEKLPVYNTFLRVYMNLKDYKRAEHFARLIHQQYDRLDFFDKYYFLNSTGMLHYYQQQYPKALCQYRQMEKMIHEHPDQFNSAEANCCKINLADTYTELSRTDSARHYLDEALQYFTPDLYPSYHFYGSLIQIRIALREHQYAEAERIAARLGDESCIPSSFRVQWYDCMYQLCTRKNDFRQALHYKTRHDQLNDSTLSHDVQLRTAEIQTRYQQDTLYLHEKIKRKELQTQVANQQLHLYFWVTICLTLILTGCIFYYHIRKRQQKRYDELQTKMAAIRMESIRNRISPHFLMNALAHEVNAPQHDTENIRDLVQLLRHNLTLVHEKFITLQEELKFIRLYVEIERRNLPDDRFIFEIHTGEGVEPQNITLPSMMIQILVENAMKHGLRGKEGVKYLGIALTPKDGALLIEVTDNGGGFQPGRMTSPSGTGTGLRVITQTLQLLNQRNRKSIQFDIRNEIKELPSGGKENCCIMCITIPEGYNFNRI